MSGSQKVLLFQMGIAVAAAAAFFTIRWVAHNPSIANVAWLFMVLYSFTDRLRDKQPLDERDHTILRRAAFVGFAVLWILVVLTSITANVLVPEASISISALACIPMVGYLIFAIVQSCVGLWLYAQGS